MQIHVVAAATRFEEEPDRGAFDAAQSDDQHAGDPLGPGHLKFEPDSPSASTSLFSAGTGWTVLDFAITLLVVWLVAEYIRPHATVFGTHQFTQRMGLLLTGILFAIFTTICSRRSGLHRFDHHRAEAVELLLVIQSVTLAGFSLLGFQTLSGVAAQAPQALVAETVLIGMAMFLSRTLAKWYRQRVKQRGVAGRKILIVGADQVGLGVRDYLASLSSAHYSFLGFISTCEDIELPKLQAEIVGDIHDLITTARSRFADEIIFSRRPHTPGVLTQVLQQAKSVGIDVRLIPSLSETLNNRPDVQYIENLPTISILQNRRRPISLLLKRVIDIVGALLASAILSPLFLVIAIAIKASSSGPIFYTSKRVGYKGTVFSCYKFRTMVAEADSMQARLAHLNERSDVLFKIAKDPRVTRLGAILRKYSLDELPQLWNVLRGDMSLVGPRPCISSEVAQYKIAHLRRLDVTPGITGLWQVEARQNPSFDRYIALDSTYVNTWSIWLDLKILVRTVSAVLSGTGS